MRGLLRKDPHAVVDVAQLVATSAAFDLPVADRADGAGEAGMPNGGRSRDGFGAQLDSVVDVAQLVRAPDCDSGGRGFESRLPPQK